MKAVIVMAPNEVMGLAVVNDGDEQAAVKRLEPLVAAPLDFKVLVQPVDVLADLVNCMTDLRAEVLRDMAEDGERAAGRDGSR